MQQLGLVLLGVVALAEGGLLLRQRLGTSTAGPGPAFRLRAVGTAGSERSGAPSVPGGVAAAATTPAAPGRLTVQTQPPGAAVFVDGARRGLAPVTVGDLPSGNHIVLVKTRHGELRQDVRVSPGESVSVVVPLSAVSRPVPIEAAAPSDGFLVVRAPFEVRVLEGERLVGTSAMDRIALARGSHTLTLTNEDLGFEQSRSVTVANGKTATISVNAPAQRVAVNAVPWADVSIDGQRVGQTPLGSLNLTVGPHDVVFVHPELGQKRLRVVVRGDQPARISVDMRKQ